MAGVLPPPAPQARRLFGFGELFQAPAELDEASNPLTREREFQPARKRVESQRAGSEDPAYSNNAVM